MQKNCFQVRFLDVDRGDAHTVHGGNLEEAHAAYERALAAMPENLPGRTLIEAKRDDSVRDAAPAGASS